MPNKRDLEGAPTGGGGGTGGGRGGSGRGRINRIPVDKPMTPKQKAKNDAAVIGTFSAVVPGGIIGIDKYVNSRKASENQKHVNKIYKWKVASPTPSPSRSVKPKSKGKK